MYHGNAFLEYLKCLHRNSDLLELLITNSHTKIMNNFFLLVYFVLSRFFKTITRRRLTWHRVKRKLSFSNAIQIEYTFKIHFKEKVSRYVLL